MSSMPGIWRETTGKYAITLHSCIPVTDKVKINEQNQINRYRIPLRTNQTRSELKLPADRYGGFEPQGVSDVVTLARS